MKHKVIAAGMLAAGMFGLNVAQASLVSVGTGLVYDSVANVTWSSDANLLGTMEAANPNLISQIISAVPTVHDTPNLFDNAGPGNYNLSASDFYTAGHADWFGSMAFIGYLNSVNYLGHNTWELPTTYDQTCGGYNCTNSMLGELFYTALGGTAGTTMPASGLFTNVQADYWSGTEANALLGWSFATVSGYQSGSYKPSSFFSWAVLPGNAGTVRTPGAAVPEPAGLALFGLGLLGLMAGRRRG